MDKTSAASAVLECALAHVPFDGWTQSALAKGAEEAGFSPADLIRVFPGGINDAMKLFAILMDEQMLASYEASPFPPAKIRDKIAMLVRLRLEALSPHREAVRRAMAFYAMPLHAHQGMAVLSRTVDAMWHAAGDGSTDFNWYTKRFLLAGVYTSTLLVWLNDKSEGHAHTWEFLSRRIEDVMKIQSWKKRLGAKG